MSTILRYASVLGRVVKSRLFGAAALAVVSAVLVMSCLLYTARCVEETGVMLLMDMDCQQDVDSID